MTVLHAHTTLPSDTLWEGVLFEVMLDALIDTLKILPFLFLTYLLMEFIEHKASEKTQGLLKKSGNFGPAIGGILGVLPQCAFSAVASNLYTGRIITLGTLISVFLATSDEMLPMMIGESLSASVILPLLAYKVAVAVIIGFAIDLVCRLIKKEQEDIDIDSICENDNCHCERGILFSAVHHTLTISAFIFIITVAINALVFFVGADRLGEIMTSIPVLSHLIAAIVGLIPGCATSVALTSLGLHGIISVGTMLSGLFSAAGVGVLILLRLNRRKKENLIIILTLIGVGFIFGILADIIGFSDLLGIH